MKTKRAQRLSRIKYTSLREARTIHGAASSPHRYREFQTTNLVQAAKLGLKYRPKGYRVYAIDVRFVEEGKIAVLYEAKQKKTSKK